VKVLVTGGRGFIGRATCTQLAAAGHDPVVFDRTYRDPVPGCDTFFGDITDPVAVTEAMAHVDGWIHLAGVLGTQETIANPRPAAHTNIVGALNVFEAAAQYDLPGVNIAVGNHWMRNTYSITKTASHAFADMFRDERGLPVTTVRALNAYGPGQSVARPYGSSKVRKIMPSFVHRALDGQPIEVYGDGSQVMDMIHVVDVARVLVAALDHTAAVGPTPKALSAGSGRPTTVVDIARMVADEVAHQTGQPPVPLAFLPMRPGEPPSSVVLGEPSTCEQVGIDPATFVRLEDGIAGTVESYR
jgi:UDP-glucose 4-epimerase